MRALIAALALMGLCATALAQNLSLNAPPWAARLLASDILASTGGRAALPAEGVDLAVRVTIAPNAGGVARVIRFEQRGEATRLFLRRFTGHPNAGWWLWGPDFPLVTTLPPAALRDVERWARQAASNPGAGATDACPLGERAFVELSVRGRAATATRDCVDGVDPLGQLITRLSDLAGSRTEEELAAAAVAELLAADQAFASAAATDAVAAQARFAAPNLRLLRPSAPGEGASAARLALPGRAPEGARVSSRGDMGWTWGAAGALAYQSVWVRDDEGAWRIAADSATAR